MATIIDHLLTCQLGAAVIFEAWSSALGDMNEDRLQIHFLHFVEIISLTIYYWSSGITGQAWAQIGAKHSLPLRRLLRRWSHTLRAALS